MPEKRRGKSRQLFSEMPASFYEMRIPAADELQRRMDELEINQAQTAEIIGVTQPRVSVLVSKNYARDYHNAELVQLWKLLESLMHLGANLVISVDSYSSPTKGSVEFHGSD